jgi:hypothetical protein
MLEGQTPRICNQTQPNSFPAHSPFSICAVAAMLPEHVPGHEEYIDSHPSQIPPLFENASGL